PFGHYCSSFSLDCGRTLSYCSSPRIHYQHHLSQRLCSPRYTDCGVRGIRLVNPILRSLSPKDGTSNVKVEPIPQYRNPRVHPLFMTPRPARDTNFVIRKTKNRGRISRNCAGE